MSLNRAILVSPYFPQTVGGGEKYLLDVALVLSSRYQVEIAIPSLKPLTLEEESKIRADYSRFMGRDLNKIRFVASPIFTTASAIKKYFWTRQYQLLYYVTDGSLFIPGADKNILHVQTPLNISRTDPISLFKRRFWQVINTNSEFTKQVVERVWGWKVDAVHHPMIDVQRSAFLSQKQKTILHVGRFFKQLHSKRQDVLVKIFDNLVTNYPEEAKGWKLVLVGNVEDQLYLAEIKKLAKNLPVEFYHELDRSSLEKLYQQAAIYWHATGFNLDEDEHPEKMEHFGISTVEAMASGAVPIVINKGGQPEILGQGLEFLLWETEAECIQLTKQLMSDEQRRQKLARLAVDQSTLFDSDTFEDKLWKMVN